MNDYIRKTIRVSLFGLKNNRMFIALMFIFSLSLALIWGNGSHGDNSGYNRIITAAMGVLLPVIMFGYVQKRNECDFYNSMPIKRSQYFIGYTISSFLAFLIVYLPINLLLAAFRSEYANQFFQGFAVFFVIFAVTVLAVMLSGSLFSTVVTLIILNLAVFEIWTLILMTAGVDTYAYINTSSLRVIYMFTPFSITDINNIDMRTALLMLLTAAVNLAVSFFLHRFRRSESSLAVAFPRTRYVIQYMAMFLAALFMSSQNAYRYSPYYNYSDGRSFGNFVKTTFNYPDFFPYTFIGIFVVFVITNMIFENTPRGALKKLRHLFIFSAGYAAFFIFVIGGVLYTNMPYTFVPFDSNLVLVSVYTYECKGKVEILDESASGAYSIEDRYDGNGGYRGRSWSGIYDEPVATTGLYESGTETAQTGMPPSAVTETAETVQPKAFPPDFDPNGESWSYSYTEDGYTYYIGRSDDTEVFLITDKEYIDYLCERVRKAEETVSPSLGLGNILENNRPWSNDIHSPDFLSYKFEGETDIYTCNIQFFSMNGEDYGKYTAGLEQDGGEIGNLKNMYDNHFLVRTYIDTEESYEELVSHAAYSVLNPPSYNDVDILFK